MAKNTKALSGPAKRKYFRDILGADPGVTEEAARRLTDRLDGDVAQMRVRGRAAPPKAAKTTTKATNAVAAPTPGPAGGSAEDAAARAQAPAAAFDPHGFSLIVVMTREGADGLRRRLDAIGDPAQLKALARAQHVAVDAALEDLEALKAAIVAGTAQRIADRRAAAS